MKIGIKDQNIIKLGNFHIYKTPFGLSNYGEALRLADSYKMQLLTEEAVDTLLQLPKKMVNNHLIIADSWLEFSTSGPVLDLPPMGYRWLGGSTVCEDAGFYRFGNGSWCFTFSDGRWPRVQPASHVVEFSFLLMKAL